MNKLMNRCLTVVFITNILILFWATETFADHVAEEVQTQANKRTDLFEKSVDDLKSLEKQLENGNQANINSMGDGKTNSPQGLSFITKKSKSELENESKKLEAIHENDLNSLGREEIIKNNTLNELYPDYSRSLNKQLMKDAKAIAEAQNDLLDNLLTKLKELGVDCKTIKGDQKHEPEYFLKLKNSINSDSQRRLGRGSGDTIYNQTFCEELRNKYSCNDSVVLTCVKRGMQWNPWQYREVQIAGDTVYHGANHLGYAIFWKKKRWGWHLHLDSAGWRVFLSNHLNIPLVQIHEQIHFLNGARGVGDNNHPVYDQWRVVFDTYAFGYSYRDGHEICEQWAEDWTEKCRLQ